MAERGFKDVDVRVVDANGGEDDWVIPVDPTLEAAELLPDLIEALQLPGSPADYSIELTGSVGNPMLQITQKRNPVVGKPVRRARGQV